MELEINSFAGSVGAIAVAIVGMYLALIKQKRAIHQLESEKEQLWVQNEGFALQRERMEVEHAQAITRLNSAHAEEISDMRAARGREITELHNAHSMELLSALSKQAHGFGETRQQEWQRSLDR